MSVKEELEHLLKPQNPILPAPAIPSKRTLGGIQMALEAQRIYNPSLPSVPKPTTPTKPETLGTAANMDTEGRWGHPEK